MMTFIEKTCRYLWAFVELAFVALLAIVLFYLLVGQDSGTYVLSVIDNLTKFAGGVPTPSLIGLAIVGLLIYMAAQRIQQSRVATPRTKTPAARPRASSDS